MTDWGFDQAIAALARQQHGVFAIAQVHALGGSEKKIHQRVATGRWIELDAGVYGLPGHPPSFRRELKAAELCDPRAAVSGRPALALQGVPGFGPCPAEIIVPLGSNSRCRLAKLHRSDLFDAVVVDGIRAVSIAHALHQVAHRLGPVRLGRALDDAVAAQLLTYDAMRERFVRLAPHHPRGIATARIVLNERGDGYVPAESELERLLWQAVRRAGLEGAAAQVTPPWWPPNSHRVDIAVEPLRLILEADGRRWHTRVADFERDRERDNTATLHGWGVLRYTWQRLTTNLPSVVRELRTIGQSANPKTASEQGHAETA